MHYQSSFVKLLQSDGMHEFGSYHLKGSDVVLKEEEDEEQALNALTAGDISEQFSGAPHLS